MPRWVVVCPSCSRPFLYQEVDPSILEEARRDPFSIIRKPLIEKEGAIRECTFCRFEVRVKGVDLTYSFL